MVGHHAGNAAKAKSRAALERDEAEAQARRNAAAGDDGEAEATFSVADSSDSSDDGFAPGFGTVGRKRPRRRSSTTVRMRRTGGATSGRSRLRAAPLREASSGSDDERGPTGGSEGEADDAAGSDAWSDGADAALRSAYPRCAGLASLGAQNDMASDDAERVATSLAGRDPTLRATGKTAAEVRARVRALGLTAAGSDDSAPSHAKLTRLAAAVAAVTTEPHASDAAADGADGAAAVEWLSASLRRAALTRANYVALNAPDQEEALFADEGDDGCGTNAEAPDIPLAAWSTAQRTWLRDSTFSVLLRECGMVPSDNSTGIMGWQVPGVIPASTLLAMAAALSH